MKMLVLGLVMSLCIIAIWLTYRSFSRYSSSQEFAIGLLACSTFIGPIISGFPIFQFTTPIGDFDAVVTWFILALAGIESASIRRETIHSGSQRILLMVLLLGWVYIALLKVYQQETFRPSFAYLPVAVLMMLRLSPSVQSFMFVSPIVIFLNILLFISMLTRFQSDVSDPSQSLDIRGVEYQNFLWDIFGTNERFRGPFSHPNSAAEFLSFSAILLFASRRKIYKFSAILPILLLGLAASRGGLVVTSLSIILIFLINSNSKSLAQFNVVSKLYIGLLVTSGFVVFYGVLSSRTTLTGRTTTWRNYLLDWRSGFWFGDSLSIPPTENVLVYVFASSGIFGLLFILYLLVKLIKRTVSHPSHRTVIGSSLLLAFIIRGAFEVNFQLGVWDIGTYTFVMILFTNGTPALNPQESRISSVNER